jgi:acetyl esterase/lipase
MVVAGLSALLTATSAAAQGGADPQPKRIAIYDDLQYRSGGNAAWQLDLAMPENFAGQRHPAIVIIHGGGWSGGSRRDRPYRSMLV